MVFVNVLKVAVRNLAAFCHKSGDLDLRFTPAPTAVEGIEGHQTVYKRRSDSYQQEVSLNGEYTIDDDYQLKVSGRADGYDPDSHCLEEIKTFRGEVESILANHTALHWAQAKIYGHLFLLSGVETDTRNEIQLSLVYFNVDTKKEFRQQQEFSRSELQCFFQTTCEQYSQWAIQQQTHLVNREKYLAKLKFPYADFRPGQRQLAEAVYKGSCTQTSLLIEAPTGIGKTLATLFPKLKAQDHWDKLFFLAAKTPGRQLALDAAKSLVTEAEPLRVLELQARDKTCVHLDKACHGESCPLAKGFYDRLSQARESAAEITHLNQTAIKDIAQQHEVCPYYLNQEMTKWADVIVGDYNYFFDISAMLYSLTQMEGWRVSVLVDEAHNLIERGRKAYSATLARQQLINAKRSAPGPIKKSLQSLNRIWLEEEKTWQKEDHELLAEAPNTILQALQIWLTDYLDYLNDHPDTQGTEAHQFFFDANHFCRVAELYDESFCYQLSWQKKKSQIKLRNLVPASQLAKRFENCQSATLFSATLSPFQFYLDMLGLPDATQTLRVASPFQTHQLQVSYSRNLSTRFQHRQQAIGPIGELIARQFQSTPGNYFAFFSSFDLLQQVEAWLSSYRSQVRVIAQQRHSTEIERQAFLSSFTEDSQQVGLAVLGGAFAEGVDLPGQRLIGAFIATLGLPQWNQDNEILKERIEQLMGDGYEYTYLYPGLQKVVQAAGRVVRTLEDKGVVFLLDDRFGQAKVQKLLPDWWNVNAIDLDLPQTSANPNLRLL